MLQNQEIFIQESKALKNRTIDIICRGSLIPNTSVLNKYYQKNLLHKPVKRVVLTTVKNGVVHRYQKIVMSY